MHIEVQRPTGGVPADVVVTTSGAASLGELIELRSLIAGLDGLGPGTRILVDHTAVDPAAMDTDDARTLGAGLRLARDRGPDDLWLALVAESPAVFGCLRQMLAFAEIDADRAGQDIDELRLRVFPTRAEAAAWLGVGAARSGSPLRGGRPTGA